jgi:hypothetical protein
MRTELIDYFKSLKLRNFKVSDELPFVSGTEMYVKNAKTVYTDMTQKVSEQVLAVLGNHGVFQQVDSVSVFFTTDAKNLPSDYDSVTNALAAGKNVDNGEDYFRREVDVVTSFEGDLILTTLEFRFTKIT